jgi:hypothetical protein
MSDVHDDYVAGDINTIDDGDIDDNDINDINDNDNDNDNGTNDIDIDIDDEEVVEEFNGADSALTATAALEFIAKSLAEDPSAVSVEVSERQGKVVLSLSVGPNDMGRIIGRRGRTAQAIRALVGAAGVRDGVTTSVDIVD